MARAKFVDVFEFPTDILRPQPTFRSSNANLVVGNGQEPIMQYPVDSLSFGWLDEISISQDVAKPDSFFALIPRPNEDPWLTHAPTLTLYHLEASPTAEENIPGPSATPGSVSHTLSETFLASVPLSASASPTLTSSSFYTRLVMGRHRTALWLSPGPREWDVTGLVQIDVNRQEDWPSQAVRTPGGTLGDDLVWTFFGQWRVGAGPQPGGDEIWKVRMEGEDLETFVFTNHILNSDGENWTAIGYDEETGRVALGRRNGYITFLRL